MFFSLYLCILMVQNHSYGILATICGKNLEAENFGERLAIHQNFPPTFINTTIFDQLPAGSPNLSLPKALEPLVRQIFLPPKFSHVW